MRNQAYRRGVWTGGKNHRLERGYCNNFIKGKSYNANAQLSEKELNHASYILTIYKYLTRNCNTDMKQPLAQDLLHDRKFIASCEAFVKKKMIVVPDL